MQYRYRQMLFPGGLYKAVTFSYDDGNAADVRLSDIFTKYGMKATFNLNSRTLRSACGVSDDEIRAYSLERGHEIAIHGYMHRAAGQLRPIEVVNEYLDSRRDLEARFGKIIRGMAYPDSGVNRFNGNCDYSEVKSILASLDIAYARTAGASGMNMELPTDWHAWSPTAHHSDPRLFEYIDKLFEFDPEKVYISALSPKLLYIWGHSYEFNNADNWDLIERICERLATKRDEIWFATNIEIYDYTEAYRSLVYSADGYTVYNPTLYDIWFQIDRKPYCIRSGETLNIERQ